jgi:hypothetical protein
LPAKIVVTAVKGGSRISLLGSSGKELLGSATFQEPRAKGATLRALKGLLGDTVVEDHTLRTTKRPAEAAKPAAEPTPAVVAPVAAKKRPAAKRTAAKKSAPKAAKAAAKAASEATAPVSAPKVAAARKTTKAATARP